MEGLHGVIHMSGKPYFGLGDVRECYAQDPECTLLTLHNEARDNTDCSSVEFGFACQRVGSDSSIPFAVIWQSSDLFASPGEFCPLCYRSKGVLPFTAFITGPVFRLTDIYTYKLPRLETDKALHLSRPVASRRSSLPSSLQELEITVRRLAAAHFWS